MIPEPSSESRPGRRDERRVCEFLQEKGYEFIAANRAIAKVEIDLIMRNPADEICLIEVKSLRSPHYIERRVTPTQARRIRFALRIVLERGIRARAHLACVGRDNVDLIEDFFVREL